MNKLFYIFSIAALALGGYKAAHAQSQTSAAVGNPDSNNMVIVEEGYEVVTPAAAPAAQMEQAQPNTPNVSAPQAVQDAPTDTGENAESVTITEEEVDMPAQ